MGRTEPRGGTQETVGLRSRAPTGEGLAGPWELPALRGGLPGVCASHAHTCTQLWTPARELVRTSWTWTVV